MCKFFSFVTNPDHDKNYYYFDWQMRQSDKEGADSHSHICAHFNLNEDKCNKYEFNPLTGEFKIDMQNAKKNDHIRAKRWVESLNWKLIVEPLIIKPIVNPFDLPKIDKPTDEQVGLLKEWVSVGDSVRALVRASVGDSVWASVRASVGDSVGDSVWDSVGDSVWDSVWDSVGDSVWASVGDSVWASVWDSVWDSVRAYIYTFFAIEYKHDFSSVAKLWEAGLVPSFDGTTWRLHSGKNADVVYEWQKETK